MAQNPESPNLSLRRTNENKTLELQIVLSEKAYLYGKCLANANRDFKQLATMGDQRHATSDVFNNLAHYVNSIIWKHARISREDLLYNALAVTTSRYHFGDVFFLDAVTKIVAEDSGLALKIADMSIEMNAQDFKPARTNMIVHLGKSLLHPSKIIFEYLSNETIETVN